MTEWPESPPSAPRGLPFGPLNDKDLPAADEVPIPRQADEVPFPRQANELPVPGVADATVPSVDEVKAPPANEATIPPVNEVPIPIWRDTTKTSLRRAAHWLASEVGEGGKFTKSQLRRAIPEWEQVDRRERDLRADYGWRIDNYRTDRELNRGEHKLVKIGTRVWEEQLSSQTSRRVSSATRAEVFRRDHNYCRKCGIGPHEEYPDLPGRTARLTIAHLDPKARRGSDDLENLQTQCARCNEEIRDLSAPHVDAGELEARIKRLGNAKSYVPYRGGN